jgi:drug/metabolite transporter (DMT)-like permease
VTGAPAALAASLLWGSADFLAGRAGRRHPSAMVAFVGQTASLVLLAPVLLARGADGAAVPAGAAAGLVGIVGVLSLYRALALGPISVVAPICATGTIVPMIYGVAEGDRPGPLQWLGVAAALTGVILASTEAGDEHVPPSLRVRSRNGVKLAVVAAVAIGVTLVFFGNAADHDALTGVAVARLVTVPALALVVFRRRASAPVRVLPSFALIGVLDTSANIAFAYATTGGLLTLVAMLGGLFPVVTVGLAYLLLHERLQPLQRAGVLLALTGIPLVSV